MGEFKVPEDNGNQRQETTVSISILDKKTFEKIKGYMSLQAGRQVHSDEVTGQLIKAWMQLNRQQATEWIRHGDAN
jgi:hypothetical protein